MKKKKVIICNEKSESNERQLWFVLSIFYFLKTLKIIKFYECFVNFSFKNYTKRIMPNKFTCAQKIIFCFSKRKKKLFFNYDAKQVISVWILLKIIQTIMKGYFGLELIL